MADLSLTLPRTTSAADATPAARTGVLLVNLGSPDAATPAAVRRYLREFLSDPRVIRDQGLVWKLVLNGIILPTRPASKARAYAKIWNTERNEAPLKTITRAQAEKLPAALGRGADGLIVDWAMRYGSPSIASKLEALRARGCSRVLIVPLYPQYAWATTATVTDEAYRALDDLAHAPLLRIASPYYNDPAYIDALAASVTATLKAQSEPPEVVLASFHGIPKSYSEAGDPYAGQCVETTRLLRERLGLGEDRLMLTFQSRFGREEWLTPYTDKTIEALARRGVKSIAVVMPGFAADCLETLEEIAIENADIFRSNGGKNFAVVPCLNDSPGGMAVLAKLVQRELQAWQ